MGKGILKVMLKMGVLMLYSYKGAVIFEVVGFVGDVVEWCFLGTVLCIEGIGFEVIVVEVVCWYWIGYFIWCNVKCLVVLFNIG